jgi:hypothetical protein
VTKSDAYAQFAMWLSANHPAVFADLVSTSKTLGRMPEIYRGSFSSRREASRATLGDYADYFSDAAVTVSYDIPSFSIDSIDPGALDLSTGGSSLESEISSETSGAASLTPTASVADSVPTMPPVAPTAAASSVGSTLASNAGLIQATLSAANTIVTSNAAAAVIAAQAQRAAAGLAPANVGYTSVTDPTTGAVSLIPVLNTGSGQLPLSTSGIDQLAPATFLQNYGLYIMLGLAALVVAME